MANAHGGIMTQPLSPTARRIQDLLAAMGFQNTVIEFPGSTRTAQEAADRAGCQLGQITKSLIFRGKQTGKAILVLTSGANHVDEKRLAEQAGEPIGRAEADFVREMTGFSIGGVPPIGHAQPLETYIDEDLLLYESIWAAAGTPNAIFELTPAQLQALTGGKTVRVK
jgi:prolyl-tRNA editing enzyme YbaK/EbsC (Cys-tRNA(Pro) deacylase)